MTNTELAVELRRWAKARMACNQRRSDQGKEPLDSILLTEAADRLENTEKEPMTAERAEALVSSAFSSVAPIDLDSKYSHVRLNTFGRIRMRLIELIVREV